jgi:tripartite ATP-independent transporter DctP family solute receptor
MLARKMVVTLVAAIVVVALGVEVQAQTKTFTMRTSTPLSQYGSVGKGLKRFADLVAERSGGRIKTTVNYAGELGSQRETVEMVRDGSLEVVTTLATGTAGWVPQLGLFEFPYIYKDEAHLVRVLNALEGEVSRLLAPHNFIAVGGQNMGFRHMLNRRRPLVRTADLKGLKMRGPNPVYVGMFNALGASGMTTDWSEIYTALQTGVIDGMEASPDMLLSMKFHEQAKYLSKTNHIAACVYYMIRKNWYEGLPKDLQEIVMKAAREAAAYQNKVDVEAQDAALQKMLAEGLQVNDVSSVKEFQTVLESFKANYVKEKGAQWKDLYDKIVAVP